MDVRGGTEQLASLYRWGAERSRHWLLIIFVGLFCFGMNLGATRLWDVDESIFSETAKEMLQRGDLITPYYNGQLFTHKPPFLYWCQILGFSIWGPTAFAARLSSAVFGIGTLLLTYELGRILFNARTGLWAGIILAGCINFAVIARAATPDSHLTFWCTLALLVLVRGTRSPGIDVWVPTLPPSWSVYLLAYASMAVAALVKGPVGIILPMAVWGMFLLIEQDRLRRSSANTPESQVSDLATASWWRRAWLSFRSGAGWFISLFEPISFLKTVWRMRPITAIACLLAIAGPWYTLVGLRTGGEFLREFFLVQNVGRATQAMEHHNGPIVYYLISIVIGTFPWSLLLGPAISHVISGIRRQDASRAGLVLISCWACVWTGCFSLVATKLSNYVVPAYPAVALGLAWLVESWLRQTALAANWQPVMRRAWTTLTVLGIAGIVILPIAMNILFNGEWTPVLICTLPLAAAVIGYRVTRLATANGAVVTLATFGILFAVGTLGFAALVIDQHKNTHLFADVIRKQTQGASHVITYKYSPPSLAFYGDQIFERLRSRTAVKEYLETAQDDVFLITTEKQLTALDGYLPTDWQLLKSERMFLKPETIVLLHHSGSRNKTPQNLVGLANTSLQTQRGPR